MSDKIDQIFEGAAQSQEGFVEYDPSDFEVEEEQPSEEQPQAPAGAPQPTQVQQPPQRIAGSGPERDPIGGLIDQAQGAYDQVTGAIQGGAEFLEDKIGVPLKSFIEGQDPEEARAELKQQREEETVVDDALEESQRIIVGGVTGAAESALNTAEIIGDTGKTFATLGNVDETQNPFSNKYEWATWDLGKDELGAQTGIGKVGQGFLEFGIVMAATGGFGGLQGAGLQYANAATKLGKAGVVLKAAGVGGLHGIAADMISATRGEGNLSNGLRALGLPEGWTPLAIEPDDSPWVAMGKTSLEGFGLGGAADGFGAWAAGVWETGRLLKAGVPEAEAGLAGAKVAQEKVTMSQPFVPQSGDDVPMHLRPISEQVQRYRAANGESGTRISRSELSVTAQLSMGDRAYRRFTLPNNAEVRWDFMQDTDFNSAYGISKDIKAVDVSWDLSQGTEIGPYGRQVASDFNRMAREEFEPGTILMNSPAEDSYGRGASAAQRRRGGTGYKPVDMQRERELWIKRGETEQERAYLARDWDRRTPAQLEQLLNDLGILEPVEATAGIRERLYSRMGFGRRHDDGMQYAIVRATPDGRGRWLEPINLDPERTWDDVIGDAQEAYVRAQGAVGLSPDEALFKWDSFSDAKRKQYASDYIASGSIKGQGAENVQQIMEAVNTQRGTWGRGLASAHRTFPDKVEGIQGLYDQARRQIPVTWDDVAQQFPEFFEAGAREVLPDFSPAVYKALENVGEGFTINPFTGEVPTSGVMVAIDGKSLREFDADSIAGFIADNHDVLSRDDVFLGGWISEETGKPVIELSRLVADENQAKTLGYLFDQEGVFRLDDFEYISTGGKDALKETIGGHIDTHFGKPMESPTVDTNTSLVQQMNARMDPLAPPVSQPTITRPQLARLARASGDEAGELLRRMVRRNPVNLNELSSVSRQTPEQVVQEAWQGLHDALGTYGDKVDFDKILRQNVGGDELLSRAGIVQVRGLMAELSGRLYEKGFEVLQKSDASLDLYPQVQQMAEDLKGLMRIHKESANAYSRYLSTYKIKIPKLGIEIDNPFKPPSPEELAKQIKDADGVLDDLVKKMASGDPKAQQEAIRLANALVLNNGDPSKMPTIWKYARQILGGNGLNIMYNSMLSAPVTHEVNLLSNSINTFYRPLAAAKGGDARIQRAAAASMYSFHRTLWDSLKMGAYAIKNGPVNDGGKTLLRQGEVAQKLQMLQRSAEVSDDVGFKAYVGFISMTNDIAQFPLFSWPSRLLTGNDEMFKTMISRMEFHSQTMLKAIDASANSEEPVQEIFKGLVKENFGQNFGPNGEILNPDLLKVAKEATFQTELEGPAKAFGDFVQAVPGMRMFFPFVKTGHDIQVFAAEHVPFLSRHLREVKEVMAGDDEYAKAVMRGRQAYGRLLVLATAALGITEAATGNGPPDPTERKMWLMNNQPRSLNLTKLTFGLLQGEDGKDKFLDYSRIEPFGQILSGGLDLIDMFRAGRLSEDRAKYLAGYMTYAISSNFTNKSYFQGVIPLSQALSPGWQGLQALQTLPAEVVNNFIPLASLRRTIANSMTPYSMEWNSQFDRLLYQASAGIVNFGAPSYDFITGEQIPYQGGGVNALLPLKVTDRGGNIVKDKLEDIEFDSTVVMKTLGGIKLDAKHRSRLQYLMGTSGLQRELKQWVTHKNFDAAVQDFRDKLRNGERVDKKNELFYREIVSIITKYRDQALEQVKQEFPELNTEINLRRQRIQAQKKVGSSTDYEHFENLVNMPRVK